MTHNIFTTVCRQIACRQYGEQGKHSLVRIFIVVHFLLFLSLSYAQDDKGDTSPAAFQWYKELAAQGDVDAKYNLGMMNETGWSVPVNVKKAIRWYREAAKQKHAEAQVRLGMLYYLGLGAKKSKLKGESWIRKAAKQGHNFAQSLNDKLFEADVSDALDKNSVLRKVRKIYLQDEVKAAAKLNQLISAAKRESTTQQRAKEVSTIRERREDRVAGTAKVKVEKGDAGKITGKPGVTKIATDTKKNKFERIESAVPEFIENKSLKENRTLARGDVATIRLQAKKGLASAQYNLGRMHELGVKVPVDGAKALAWYKKAAAQGYADAEYRLAISMLYGKSAERNEALGRKWLSSAAGNDHQVARSLLASLANQEGGFSSGNSLAVSWYLERAIAGNANAAVNLGKIFEHGWGVIPDLREATKWYEHAQMLGAIDVENLLKDLKVRLAQAKETGGEAKGVTENFLPPDWIAYLMAFLLAVGIIFWPMLRRGKKTETNAAGEIMGKQDPPFG